MQNTPEDDTVYRNRLDKGLGLDSANSKYSSETVIRRGLMREFPFMPAEISDNVSRELVFKPEKSDIKLGNEDFSTADLRFRTAAAIEEIANRRETDTFDLRFRAASSIEAINSETSVQEEYFRWIATGQQIIKHLNDGKIEQKEVDEKYDFIGHLDQREGELMTCLGLYQSSTHPDASKKYEELLVKLNKLREIRSSIKMSTVDTVTQEPTEKEKERAAVYVKALAYLGRVSMADKERLGIDSGDYSPTSYQDKAYYNHIVHFYTYQEPGRHHDSYAEEILFTKNKEQTEEDLRRKLELLSGRKNKIAKELRIAPEYVEEIRKRRFDRERFMRLNRENAH